MPSSNQKYPPGYHIGNPLMKRTADSIIVTIFWNQGPFIHAGRTVSPVSGWIEYDGNNYAALTDTQVNTLYTRVGQLNNMTGR